MKLLVVSHPCVTPINQQFYAEVERLSGWDVTLVIPANWKSEYKPLIHVERWPEFKGHIIEIPVWKPGSVPLHLYQTDPHTLLKKLTPDLLYIHNESYALGTIQWFWANTQVHQLPIGFWSSQNIYKNYPFPFGQLEKWVFEQADFAFALNHSAINHIEKKGLAQHKCTYLPTGLDPSIYRPAEADKLRQELGLQGFVLGYIGRFVPEKGLNTLLQALALLPPEAMLLFIGSGPEEAKLKQLAQQLNLTEQVRWLSYVPHEQIAPYYSAMDLFVLPSLTRSNWKEQFGRVLVEALACGVPVIGSDSGEIPHLINCLQGGWVFPEGDQQQLAQCIRTAWANQNLRQHHVATAQRIIAQEFTHTALAAKFIEVLQQARQHKR